MMYHREVLARSVNMGFLNRRTYRIIRVPISQRFPWYFLR